MAENVNVQSRRRNSHLLINDSDNPKTLSPIIGFAQEPLLPLADACTPLTDIVYDIFTYVSIALEHTASHPADGLTRDESASIRLYTMEWPDTHRSLYSILNSILKTADRKDLQPWFKYLKLFLTAIAKLPSVPPRTAWLGKYYVISTEDSHGSLEKSCHTKYFDLCF
ncbi:unnamed protein product [Adineta steineri]|uniref:Uncharacterized protein n=1 Tax=Adineta steineri TaxID=433720 RepID=A0A814KBE8_9BILA|nr:unnamed protein product [Adineta steineri]